MTVSVDGESGPFKFTSQNEEGIIWNRGGSETITWDVANTNESPVNTSHVDILISTDRGVSYTPLISNTPNDGFQEVAVPLMAAPYCRIMIRASNNIYYALNSHEFSIDYLVETTCNTYSDSPNIPITDNSSSFDETTITIPENVTISDVNISVDITHNWLGDLLITLLSPDGTEFKLIDRDCSSFENLEVTFDDSGTTKTCNSPTTSLILPEESLAALNGKLSTGQWTIRINDNEAEDTGTLNNWSIQICSTKLTELYGLEFLNVFPNPSSGSINIYMYSESDEPIEVSIIDMTGKHIKSEAFSPSSGLLNTPFDYGCLSQGIYVLKIVQGDKTTAKKIIVN
jgi:subtilisin-like proprotein convertase family protein